MDLLSWLGLLTGIGGVAVATYGAVVLLTGRATRGDQRAFRRTRDAGLYYLCFGLVLMLVTVSGVWNANDQSVLAGAGVIAAIAFIPLLIRYRPRQARRR